MTVAQLCSAGSSKQPIKEEGVMSELEEASNNNNRQRALMEDLMMGHTVRGELEQEDQAELTGQYMNSVP